ncbi:MAG: hypothetical protein JXO44_00110 [Clostridia bacterium]|nr:hypothetical protein [Clostridia bacterium]
MKNVFLTLIVLVAVAFGGYYYYMYHELLLEQQTAFLYDQVVINGQAMDAKHIYKDNHGRYLLSVQALQEALDPTVYLSGSKSRVYIPLLGKNIRLETTKLTQFVQENIKTVNLPIKRIEGEPYVELSVVTRLYGLTVRNFEHYNSWLLENRQLPMATYSKEKVKLYGSSDLGFKSLGKYSVNQLVVLGEKKGYSYVVTDEGEMAYIKGALTTKDTMNYFADQPLNTPRLDNNMPKNFFLTWHQVSSFENTSDIGPQEALPVDVVSPTWFALNVDGIVINEASYDYVVKAHEKGYKVWGLYSNSFKPEWTKALFESENYTDQSIAQLLIYSALYDLDGLNFDFENMYIGNKADYVAYIKAATEQLQYQNLRTSIDVTVPWGSDQWSKVYDRTALAEQVDYMCLMAYDEYWASSKKAGPVASMDWVEKGITESLKLIPKEKLVLAVPLYMRTWAIQSSGNAKSKSMGWETASGLKEQYAKDVVYDASSGQNFLSYSVDGVTHKLWLEDALSLTKRLQMSKNYDLAGTALWSKVFANGETWEIIDDAR